MQIHLANNGFFEAKIQEAKIAELTMDDTDFTHASLEKLIERKAKWAAKYEIVERLDQLEFTAIKDVETRIRFNCVAAILHVSYTDGSRSAKVYVTDYTANDLLTDIGLDTDEFDHLHKQILQVILRGSQAQKAKWLERGNICVFQKVTVKLFNKENVGNLGGDQLIDRLNPGLESHKPLIKRLESLKKNFYDASSKLKTFPAKVPQSRLVSDAVVKIESVSKPSKPRVLEPSGHTSTPLPRPMICMSIQELINREESLVAFRIPARVSWVKPRKLEDFVRRWCKNCKKHFPSEYKACVKCDDTDHVFVDFKYHFNIWIKEDGEKGLGLPVMVYDDALFLCHMPRVDLVQDPEALDLFRRWFETFAGNLIQYLDNHYQGIHTKLESPLLFFEGYRYEEDGKPIFRAISMRAVDN
jgi:protein-disulfide isomerase-like protein with CxxC motif